MKEAYRIGSRWFWSSSLSCNNDLINGKNSSCGFSGQLDRPAFRNRKVENSLFLGVKSSATIFVLI